MSNIEFEDTLVGARSPNFQFKAQEAKMAGFLINHNIVKSEKAANMVLLGLAAGVVAATIFVIVVFVFRDAPIGLGRPRTELENQTAAMNKEKLQKIIQSIRKDK